MTAQDCLQLLRDIKSVVFATTDEDGSPKARIIDVMMVEENKLYFCTARGKNFYRELTADGRVAVTGMNTQYQTVRLTGRAQRPNRQTEWIDRIFEENPAMKEVYPGNSRYILEPFYIGQSQLEFFDLGQTPVSRAYYATAGREPRQKGFAIGESCIACGRCARGCPQQCIHAGAPYSIQQEHCLHCGLCAEGCPANAIYRLEE